MSATRIFSSSEFFQPAEGEPIRSVITESRDAVVVAWYVFRCSDCRREDAPSLAELRFRCRDAIQEQACVVLVVTRVRSLVWRELDGFDAMGNCDRPVRCQCHMQVAIADQASQTGAVVRRVVRSPRHVDGVQVGGVDQRV